MVYILVYSEPAPVSLRDCIWGKAEEVRVRKKKFTVSYFRGRDTHSSDSSSLCRDF